MLHIDGDIIAYRIACAIGTEGDAASLPYTMNSFIGTKILAHFPELTPYRIYLSGTTNFRDDVGVTAPYKGNRWTQQQRDDMKASGKWLGFLADTEHLAPNVRPPLLAEARKHLVDVFEAVVYEGIEADDAIATGATVEWTAYRDSEDVSDPHKLPVICSVDKDFDQVPNIGRYDFIANTLTLSSGTEATRTLYKQVLTGDGVDNIKGLEGCGPALASLLIDGFTTQADMIAVCTDQMGMERFCENMNLVRLFRSAEEWDGSRLLTPALVEFYMQQSEVDRI